MESENMGPNRWSLAFVIPERQIGNFPSGLNFCIAGVSFVRHINISLRVHLHIARAIEKSGGVAQAAKMVPVYALAGKPDHLVILVVGDNDIVFRGWRRFHKVEAGFGSSGRCLQKKIDTGDGWHLLSLETFSKAESFSN